MAYIDGMPLSSFIKQGKIKSMRNIGVVIRKLALALESAHQKSVIHRDLKPANIMMDEGKEPVIMDFGLARQLNKEETSRLTMVGTVMGTPAYMSPEQVSGDINLVGCQSDVYSLGVILYEMLTGGELPFQGPVVAIIGQILGAEPSPPSSIKEGVDPELEAICLKMMAKKTDERYQSMQDVVDVLTAYLKKQTKSSKESPQPFPNLREPQRVDKAEQPRKSKQRLTLFEKFNNRPPFSKALAAAGCASVLFLAAAITIFFKIDDRTVEVTLNDPKAKVTFDGKHHVEFDGKMGHVELDIGRHEVTVTRDGVVVKGWEKYEYVVEKEGKNLLEIKLLDEPAPLSRSVAAVEKYRSTTEIKHSLPPRLAEMLKQEPVGVQEFDLKREGFADDRDDYGKRIFRDGRMYIESTTPRKEVRAWCFAGNDGSGVVQVDVRTVEGSGWAVVFNSDILKRGFRIALEKRKLEFGPSIWEPNGDSADEMSRVLTDKAPTNGLNQYDQLHVLIEGRTVTVFLNGEQCGTPIDLDFEPGFLRVCPGIISDTKLTKVEFERILQYPLVGERPLKAGEWVDLISGFDTKTNVMNGEWQKSGNELNMKSGVAENILRLPAKPKGSYEIEMSFARHVFPAGDKAIGLTIPVGDRAVDAVYDGWLKQISGIGEIDGLDPDRKGHPCSTTDFIMVEGKRHVIRLQVLIDGTQAKISSVADGKELFSWSGAISSLSSGYHRKTKSKNDSMLLILYGDGKTTFDKLRWRPIDE